MSSTVAQLERELQAAKQTCDSLRAENEGLKKEVSGVASANVLAAELMGQLEDAQQALETEKEELQAILDNAMEGIVTLDENGRITSVNRQAETIFGYSSDRIREKSFKDLLGPCEGDGDGALRDFRRYLLEHSKISCETRGVGSDGESIPIHLHLCKIHTEKAQFFTAIIRDLTAEKGMQFRLMQSEKLESIGRLAAGVAHEINTPIQFVGDNTRFLRDAFSDITTLLGSLVELLQAVKNGSGVPTQLGDAEKNLEDADIEYLHEEIPKAIEQSLQGIERVAEIVKAMKAFSHPGTEEKQLSDLNAAIESTVTVSRNEWKYLAELTLDLDRDLPPIPLLVGEFNQVVLNMIVNAAHAIAAKAGSDDETKGHITISSKSFDNDVEIRITDTGSGIAEDVRAKVFDPFFTTKDVGKGTGQGLAIARSVVVDKHGGAIDLESEVGEGTTFVIRLPAVEPDRARVEEAVV